VEPDSSAQSGPPWAEAGEPRIAHRFPACIHRPTTPEEMVDFLVIRCSILWVMSLGR